EPEAATEEPDWSEHLATRHLGNARLCRQDLRDDPQLLGRAPPPPSLRTSKHRNRRHMCPLTRQLMGKRSHAREPNGRRSWPDAYSQPVPNFRPPDIADFHDGNHWPFRPRGADQY